MKKNNTVKNTAKRIVKYIEFGIEALRRMVDRMNTDRAAAIETEKSQGRPTFVEFSTNSKLNGIVTFGTLPIIDCGMACKECKAGCYAARHLAMYPDKRAIMARNSARLALNRNAFFEDITNRARLSVVFRWHESGEVVDYDYFARAVEAAKASHNCSHLMFTKRYDIVNRYITENGPLPENMHVLLSAWNNVAAVSNPHNLPLSSPDFSGEQVAQKYRKPFEPAGLNVLRCTGDCSNCYLKNTGCFGAKGGDVVAFDAH